MRKVALAVAGLSAFFVGFSIQGCQDQCTVGAEGCECTGGGACDPGLTCFSGICVNAGPNPDTDVGEDNDTNDEVGTDDGESTGTTTDDGETDMESSTSSGIKLDMPMDSADDMPCDETGCSKVDMLFALDGSFSMIEEIQALESGAAFLGIVNALEGLNCGGIDYRIGVTGDNDNGWMVPNNWAHPDPWFDSEMFTPAEISVHFQAAAQVTGNTPTGCEHVLSTAVDLLGNDTSGFLRDDALLVLVLMSDVDDYGWYDQVNGNPCGIGCNAGGQPVQTLYDTLVALKDGDPAGVSTIVIAGDPNIDGGEYICELPQTCGPPVQAFHAERLWEFAGMQVGMNGYTSNICGGADQVPVAVETALTENIDLACQEFEPVG